MNTIKIISLSLLNFKGVKKLKIEFGDTTNIYGDNATGKTTIFDAFTWLLFGKDSTDRTAFEIKTLDENNNAIPKIDHEVTAVLLVNGEEIEVKRILREKWVTKRGSEEAEFTGHETTFFWNSVPLLASEFSIKVSNLIDEKIFKLITNPLAFDALKWQDKRSVLVDVVGGEKSQQEIASGNTEFEALLSKLGTNKTLDEYRKQVAASIKKSKDEIKTIPTRIDEVERGKPDALPFGEIAGQLEDKKKEFEDVQGQVDSIMEAQKAVLDTKSAIQEEIHSIKSQINTIEFDASENVSEQLRKLGSGGNDLKYKKSKIEGELRDYNDDLLGFKDSIEAEEGKIKNYEAQMTQTREEWNKRNAEVFTLSENECKCPTCKREFEADDLKAKKAEMQETFNRNKVNDLQQITAKGQQYKKLLETANSRLENFKNQFKSLEVKISEKEIELSGIKTQLENSNSTTLPTKEELVLKLLKANESYQNLKVLLSEKQAEFDAVKGVDVGDLKERRDAIKNEIDTLTAQLSTRDLIQKAGQRINELLDEEKALAQAIASEEKEQFVIENFLRVQSEELEKAVNKLFTIVKFKMFKTQINGGLDDTCEALLNGVPFSDANTASKLNGGLDIINALCNYYKVTAPIFIDNRESVVNVIPCASQLINLIVSPKDKKLRTEILEGQLAETA